MTLKRQLLLVSLLALMLPWAGCQFIRETESALRTGQQQMLGSTAKAIAESVAQYDAEFPPPVISDHVIGTQLYGHALENAPEIDGYFTDWLLDEASLSTLRGDDGPIRFALGLAGQFLYLYVEVVDHAVVYADQASLPPGDMSRHADRVRLISSNPPYREESFSFAAEAPGPLIAYLLNDRGFAAQPIVRAYWQDVPDGYQLEARLPLHLLGTHLGLEVSNTDSPTQPVVRSVTFAARSPGRFVTRSDELTGVAASLVQPGMRLLITDAAGWRIAAAGSLQSDAGPAATPVSTWLRFAYEALVEPGRESGLAEPDPGGRETRTYVARALGGQLSGDWFRSAETGRAIVAVAAPVTVDGVTLGAVILQQGTDAVLSLRNESLVRLMYVTLIAMVGVAAVLLGFATVLSRRIRRLSKAAETALDSDTAHTVLPSALAADEIGDLSRSFTFVLRRLGEYNEYLRTLASKLSHELRTPLTIVTSSLDNLEHEPLGTAAAGYTARARDGAARLQKILAAMGEASRVEEIMQDAQPEKFDLAAAISSTVDAYRDAYPERRFSVSADNGELLAVGSPELIIQMLDKLVDNAVSFSGDGDEIAIAMSRDAADLRVDISNPGPPLPERMRGRLFDSMVSVRAAGGDRHLGLGLYIARLIADGHNGRIEAGNVPGGVRFSVLLPAA